MRPRLSGNTIALWRHDFEQVNLKVRSIQWQTSPVHLWHPPAPTFARNGAGTENHLYFTSSNRPAFCIDGLVKPASKASPRVELLTAR